MPPDHLVSSLKSPLEEILTSRQLAPAAKLERWIEMATEIGVPLDTVLLREKAFTRAQLLHILENHFFCPSIDLTSQDFEPQVLTLVPRDLAEHLGAFPVSLDRDKLVLSVADPGDTRSQEALSQTAHKQVLPRVALTSDILDAIEIHYGRLERELEPRSGDASEKVPKKAPPPLRADYRIEAKTKSPVEVVDAILSSAAELGVTDIHVNPSEANLKVRFRIDGILHTVAEFPSDLTPPVVSRLKVMSQMDIAEHRIPQDGRQSVKLGGESLDLRVSSLPAQFGENIVIRMLRKDTNLLDLDKLNMPPAIREAHEDMVTSPQGFFLVTGPTGSGKTTTLYATLNAHDEKSTNIITLEDPIEYTLPGITQVHIRDDAGLTFAAGLRSILRQDPEVVLVGEIRDLETVEIACRAALTGHKVLSTLHTNDAVQAVTRLLDIGTPPHLITATLRGVLAQRLIRVNCEHCREEYAANETEIALLGYPKETRLVRGAGCAQCAGSGFRGRMAIFEYFKVEENIHRLIIDRASPYVIRHAAVRAGMIVMAEFAKKAVLEGKTTVSEIQRVIFSSESKEQLCQNCQRVVAMDFAVCPFCAHVLKETCSGCNMPLDPNWEACPGCGKEVQREWQKVFCRHCLAPVDTRWKSCRYCGEDLA